MSNSYDPILGTPKKLGLLEIAENDFPDLMRWSDANYDCTLRGSVTGWRLPTMGELNLLYCNKDEIGSFSSGLYWSSSEGGHTELLVGTVQFVYIKAYFQHFGNGLQSLSYKENHYHVRAVRSY